MDPGAIFGLVLLGIIYAIAVLASTYKVTKFLANEAKETWPGLRKDVCLWCLTCAVSFLLSILAPAAVVIFLVLGVVLCLALWPLEKLMELITAEESETCCGISLKPKANGDDGKDDGHAATRPTSPTALLSDLERGDGPRAASDEASAFGKELPTYNQAMGIPVLPQQRPDQ